jgi:hypothetical protein
MMLLLAAAILPKLFWDAPADTAAALREAGIAQIAVPAARAAEWKGAAGISVEPADFTAAVKLEAPAVDYRANEATASRSPWITSNAWQFFRLPGGRFAYEVKGAQSAIAAAEAFSHGVAALIRSDAAGLKPLARMLEFLQGAGGEAAPPVADIGFRDDGSDDAAEVMNLLARENLMFKIVRARDPGLKLYVDRVPKGEDPGRAAHAIRAELTDEKRSLRIYGSQVVIGHLNRNGSRLRVHLINYAGAARTVDGLRVRVLGEFPKHSLMAEGSPDAVLLDYGLDSGATEFTLKELKTYAVIDLWR